MIDTLLLKGYYYYLLSKPDDKINIQKNEWYKKILPNDIIEYEDNGDNMIQITNIIYRKPVYTFGILNGIVNPLKKYFFYTPLLPQNFVCNIDFHEKTQHYSHFPFLIGNLFIFELHPNHSRIIQYYGNIKDRSLDNQRMMSLYNHSWNETQPIFPYSLEKTYEPGYYTKSFQDLTHLETFNIDPTHSRDFDDAISIDRENHKIYVHIVDITQIPVLSTIDVESAWKSYTLYLSNENSPMIPREMAENTLSLIQGENRRVITVEMDIESIRDEDKNCCRVYHYEIYPSIIRIKHRYDYENVFKSMNEDIYYLKRVTETCHKKRLFTQEHHYDIHSVSGETLDIQLETTSEDENMSHQMIEMTMVMANRIVTEHLLRVGKKCPERFHEKCDIDIEDIESITNNESVNTILAIQKLKTARYDNHESSHYGLHLEHYTHFTSPIRRYFDTIVHRILAGYDYQDMDGILKHVNEREILNESLCKLYYQWKLMDYLKHHIGELFESYIISTNMKGCKFYIPCIGYDGFYIFPENSPWKYIGEEKIFINGENQIKKGCMISLQLSKIQWTKRDSIVFSMVS
jgi:exoribonuclease R